MSEQQNFGFGKFVPGFDFLQNLGKGVSQSQPAMPGLSNWIAPTLNVEELDKRIGELKAVHFWLDQNSRALGATIQALELQKMTLATLKGMNFNMADIAKGLKLDPAGFATPAARSDGEKSAGGSGSVAGAAKEAVAKARASKVKSDSGKPATGVVDPLQWWGALTQQFQEIAAGAVQEAAANPPIAAAREMAASITGQALKAAGAMNGTAAPRSAGAAKKSAAGTSYGAIPKAASKRGKRGR